MADYYESAAFTSNLPRTPLLLFNRTFGHPVVASADGVVVT